VTRHCEHGVNSWVPQNKEHFTSQEALRHSRRILLHGVNCWVLTGPSSGSPLQASTSGVQNEGNHGSMPHTLVPPIWCERHICCPVTPIKMNVKLNYPYLKHVEFLKSNFLPTSRSFHQQMHPFIKHTKC
jgi:hypothetical protein